MIIHEVYCIREWVDSENLDCMEYLGTEGFFIDKKEAERHAADLINRRPDTQYDYFIREVTVKE